MTDWNLDDIEGLPTDPVELRAWVGKARALWRNWADCKPIPSRFGARPMTRRRVSTKALLLWTVGFAIAWALWSYGPDVIRNNSR